MRPYQATPALKAGNSSQASHVTPPPQQKPVTRHPGSIHEGLGLQIGEGRADIAHDLLVARLDTILITAARSVSGAGSATRTKKAGAAAT